VPFRQPSSTPPSPAFPQMQCTHRLFSTFRRCAVRREPPLRLPLPLMIASRHALGALAATLECSFRHPAASLTIGASRRILLISKVGTGKATLVRSVTCRLGTNVILRSPRQAVLLSST